MALGRWDPTSDEQAAVDVQEAIIDYIEENSGIRPTEDMSFEEHGVFDSMGFVLFISFLEETFHIEIAEEELTPENFNDVRQVVSLVKRHLPVVT